MNLCDYNTIRDLLGRHGFHFSKSMGQNFLIDPAGAPPTLRRPPARTQAAACWRSARASAP